MSLSPRIQESYTRHIKSHLCLLCVSAHLRDPRKESTVSFLFGDSMTFWIRIVGNPALGETKVFGRLQILPPYLKTVCSSTLMGELPRPIGNLSFSIEESMWHVLRKRLWAFPEPHLLETPTSRPSWQYGLMVTHCSLGTQKRNSSSSCPWAHFHGGHFSDKISDKKNT